MAQAFEGKETPEEEKLEEGKEPTSEDGVTVSEEFQKQAHSLISKASKDELKHLRDRVYDREDEIRREEQANQDKKTKGKPNARVEMFSTSEMPRR